MAEGDSMKAWEWIFIILFCLVTCDSAFATSATWTGTTSGVYANTGNWSPSAVPNTTADTATFGASSRTTLSVGNIQVGGFQFTSLAPAYTFNASALDFAGAGIVNGSSNTQQFNISTKLQFDNSSSAGTNSSFSIGGSSQALFNNSSTADGAAITNTGGGKTTFTSSSTAGSATITANAGSSIIFNNATGGGTATLDASGTGAKLIFNNTSSAQHAAINNQSGAQVIFNDSGNASSAHLTTSLGGVTTFNSTSTANHATIHVTGAGSMVIFDNSATAASAAITNASGGVTDFNNTSTAASANIIINTTSAVAFNDTATAAGATITNNAGGHLTFNNSSTAGSAAIGNAGTITFNQTSDGGTAVVTSTGGTLDISGSAGIGLGALNGTGTVALGAKNLSLGVGNQNSNFSGNIGDTGGGSLTKVGTGSVILSGTNTHTGGTTISAGLLQIGNGGTTGSIAGDITNNSALAFNRSDTITHGGMISGTGSLTQSGTGTLILTGSNSYTGGTSISSAGTLQVGNGGTIGSIAGNVTSVSPSGGALAFNHSDTVAFGGAISGGLSVTQLGSGALVLTGANTYSGGTTISQGTLTVGSSSALGTGNVTHNSGTLNVGNGNRTINVGGVYTQGSGGTLALTVDNGGNDKMAVSGPGASTFNGTIDVNFTSPLPTLGHVQGSRVITLVTTLGGYTQNVNFIVTGLPPGLATPDFTTIPDDILLDVKAIAGTFTLTGGLTPNQTAVGDYINHALSNGKTNALIMNLGGAVTAHPGSLGGYLNQLTPLNFAQFTSSTAFNNTSFAIGQFDNYLANHRGPDGTFVSSNGGIDYSGLTYSDPNTANGLQTVHSRLLAWNPAPSTGLLSDVVNPMFGGVSMKESKTMISPEPVNRWNAFISGDVVLGQNFSDPASGLAHSDTTTAAMQLGADYRVDSHFLVGALFGYGHTDASLDTLGSTASVDTYSPGVYASYADDGWYANALGSYGFADYDQARKVAVGASNGIARSSPSGDQIVGNLDGGYDFHCGHWTVGPTGGVQYVHLDVDGFTETGLPGANLSVNQNESDSLRSRLGGRLSYAVQDGEMTFTPHLNASWQHEFLDQSRGITSQFDGLGAGSFVVNTINPSRDSALIDLGLDAQVNRSITVFADYTVQAGQDNYFGQSVQAGLKIGF
jgi:autotransporter-associated beta strand protein